MTPASFVSAGGELHLSNPGQLALLQGMAERGVALRTVVRGFSMAPAIRDQDVLTISPMNGEEPRMGEVVAFTHSEMKKMAIHRVIARVDGGWLLRGDNSPKADGVVASEQIVGRVVRVERNGRTVRLGLGTEGAWIAALNRGGAWMRLKALWFLPRRAAGFALRCAQTVPSYRALGKKLGQRIEILEATEYDVEVVRRRSNPHELYRACPKNPNVMNWVAKRGANVVGFVQLVHHPDAHFPWVGHWLFSLDVRGQYRGLGIGESLTKRVIEGARERGAEDLFLAVFENNARAIALYRKLGFEHISVAALEPVFAVEKDRYGRRRIVMRKSLITTP